MSRYGTDRRRMAAIAAVCLLSVTLPVGVATGKEKVKSAPPPSPSLDVNYSVSIPTIDAVQSSIDADVISDILSGNIAEHANALADLDAASITVPEIAIDITSVGEDGEHRAAITLNELVLGNIVDGKAATLSVAGINVDSEEGTAEFGAVSAANFDIGGILGLYGLVDHSGQTDLEVIYTDLVSEGGEVVSEDATCTIGGVRGAEFKARPLKTPLFEIVAIAQAMEEDPDTVDPALTGKFIRIYADFLTAFETSEVTFDGLSCNGIDDKGQPLTFAIGGMTMGPMTPGIYPSISMNGLTVDLEDNGSMTLESLTIKPMDLSTTIATMQSAPELVDETWLEQNARGFIPAMEGFSMSGLEFDIPDMDDPGARVRASIAGAELTLGAYVNGIPTDLDLKVDNVAAELPADSDDETFNQLRALGVTDMDASFRIAAAWDETASTIRLKELSMSGVDLASVLLAGTITNASAELFGLEPNAALAASMGLAIKDLDLTVTDAGLTEIILAIAAKQQGADPAAMRPIFAGLAQGGIISLMGGAADAAKLGEAVNAFVSGQARTLFIGIDAKTEPGLGMMDFLAAQEDPTSLLSKVHVSAEAK